MTTGLDGVLAAPGLIHKKTSVLRRIPQFDTIRYVETPGLEGIACVFELRQDESPVVLESSSGRAMNVAPGDFFLGTPGHRESTRWVVGCVPSGGLRPGNDYWILADSGVVGELIGDSPLKKNHLAKVKYRGAVVDETDRVLNLRQFAAEPARDSDRGSPIYLVVGTSAEVGKTTAGIGILRALRHKGLRAIAAFKATGTPSLTEILRYQDFGATHIFDCVDFGLPTTYPSGRPDVHVVFNRALDVVLSTESDALLIECGGDILGGNVPAFLDSLKHRRTDLKIILAAADALGALGAKQVLREMGLSVSLITGPCTDTPTLKERTQAVCEVPALNLAQGQSVPI